MKHQKKKEEKYFKCKQTTSILVVFSVEPRLAVAGGSRLRRCAGANQHSVKFGFFYWEISVSSRAWNTVPIQSSSGACDQLLLNPGEVQIPHFNKQLRAAKGLILRFLRSFSIEHISSGVRGRTWSVCSDRASSRSSSFNKNKRTGKEGGSSRRVDKYIKTHKFQ